MTAQTGERFQMRAIDARVSGVSSADADVLHPLGWLASMLKCDHAELRRHSATSGYETVLRWGRIAGSKPIPDSYHLYGVATPIGGADFSSISESVLQLPFQCSAGRHWVVVLQRTPGNTRFSADDTVMATHMLDPLRGVVSLWSKFTEVQQHCEGLRSLVHSIDCGIILLDVRGDIVFANRRAGIMLNANNGLVRVQGRITANDFREAAQLQAAVNYVLQQPLGLGQDDFISPLISIARKKSLPLTVAFLPIAPTNADGHSAAVGMYIVDPTSDIQDVVGILCQMHGLTRAETRLAIQIVAGLSLNAAARVLHVREQTARTYLRQIFSKLGVCRQAELVRFLLAGVVRIHAKFVSLSH
jgi:DNA-binding CsgD family transcriptional regulator/PAS domain-containing protein